MTLWASLLVLWVHVLSPIIYNEELLREIVSNIIINIWLLMCIFSVQNMVVLEIHLGRIKIFLKNYSLLRSEIIKILRKICIILSLSTAATISLVKAAFHESLCLVTFLVSVMECFYLCKANKMTLIVYVDTEKLKASCIFLPMLSNSLFIIFY